MAGNLIFACQLAHPEVLFRDTLTGTGRRAAGPSVMTFKLDHAKIKLEGAEKD